MGNPLQGHTDLVSSVAFSPDGSHIIVSGGFDPIHACNTQTSGQVGNALKEQTSISMIHPPICFSSSVAHALHDAQSLFGDMSNVNGDCWDLIHLQHDGWIVGPNRKLLLWVPPSYNNMPLYTPWTHLIIPRGSPELDLSKMAHGPAWHECYTPDPKDN